MKATTQYTDFEGTAAADISDHTDLVKFLQSRGIDTKRYDPIGAEFYHGYSDFFSASIICIDNEKSTADKPYIASISFEDEFDHTEFFDLFKRFKVIITKKHNGHQDREIDEEITVDDRDTEE
jgi:hypothetical protein